MVHGMPVRHTGVHVRSGRDASRSLPVAP